MVKNKAIVKYKSYCFGSQLANNRLRVVTTANFFQLKIVGYLKKLIMCFHDIMENTGWNVSHE